MATTSAFQASDRITVSGHARDRWRERGWGIDPDDPLDDREPGYPADVAWRRSRDRAVPWGKLNAIYVRYDSQTDCLPIAKRQHGVTAELVLVTVVRAEWELDRASVRRIVQDAVGECRHVGVVDP
jgi:hypothetical protein